MHLLCVYFYLFGAVSESAGQMSCGAGSLPARSPSQRTINTFIFFDWLWPMLRYYLYRVRGPPASINVSIYINSFGNSTCLSSSSSSHSGSESSTAALTINLSQPFLNICLGQKKPQPGRVMRDREKMSNDLFYSRTAASVASPSFVL